VISDFCLVLAKAYCSSFSNLMRLRQDIKIVDQHVRQAAKDRLGRLAAGVAANARRINPYDNDVLGFITAHKTNLGAVIFIGVITAGRIGDLGRTGLAANAVVIAEVKVGKTFQIVLLDDVLQQRLDLAANFGRYHVAI